MFGVAATKPRNRARCVTRSRPIKTPTAIRDLQGGAQSAGYDSRYGNVLSSDADPYGDPGLQGGAQNVSANDPRFGNVKSSDEDPYGDPGLR